MADTLYEPEAVAREMFRDQPPGFPYSGFDLKELILPDGDNMGIESDDGDVDEGQVETETGFGSVIVVDNLPKVGEDKYDKLVGLLTQRIYSQIGTIKDVFMPKGTDGVTKGYAFIEFSNPREAATAVKESQGYQLDKNHIFRTNAFDDLDKYQKVPQEYQQPALPQFQGQDKLHSWLLDKQGRDQFVIRYADEAAVFWNDARRGRAEEVYKRGFWTETFVQWSPQGNYIATMHRQGVAIWGGPEFKRLSRFNHPAAQLIEFSPNEKYLVSYTSIEPQNPRQETQIVLCAFDVRSAKLMRKWENPMKKFAVGAAAGPNGALKWPVFKWAGGNEDLYFARLNDANHISVYSTRMTAGMKAPFDLLDGKKLHLPNIVDFEWSPAEPVLAAYTSEQGDKPAKVQLVKLPERAEMRQKNLFNVSDVALHWHPQGDYLAVKVDRFTKTKKSTYTGFELFAMREKDIPMEVLELPSKADKVFAFAWEPKGHRFAVVHGESPARPSVSFYSMKDDKGRLGVKLLGTLSSKACNQIHWSPQGHNIVLAGLKSLNGQLEFFNVDEMEVMAAAEHFMATDVEWDPTGRYVATAVTAINQMENGFNIWSYNGKLLYSMQRDRFFQFSWRPRMPPMLPPEKDAQLQKNLKQYSRRYDEEDEAMLMQADADVLQERQSKQDEWDKYVDSRKDAAEKIQQFLREVYGAEADELEYTMQKRTVEQVIDIKEEPYSA